MTSVRPGSGRIQPQSGQKDGSATEKGDAAGNVFFLVAAWWTSDMSAHAHA